MHPEIRKFPSAHFYGDRLRDDVSVLPFRPAADAMPAPDSSSEPSTALLEQRGTHHRDFHNEPNYRPFCFHDLPSEENTPKALEPGQGPSAGSKRRRGAGAKGGSIVSQVWRLGPCGCYSSTGSLVLMTVSIMCY